MLFVKFTRSEFHVKVSVFLAEMYWNPFQIIVHHPFWISVFLEHHFHHHHFLVALLPPSAPDVWTEKCHGSPSAMLTRRHMPPGWKKTKHLGNRSGGHANPVSSLSTILLCLLSIVYNVYIFLLYLCFCCRYGISGNVRLYLENYDDLIGKTSLTKQFCCNFFQSWGKMEPTRIDKKETTIIPTVG